MRGSFGVLGVVYSSICFGVFIQGAGGGKCPEEEHTTCSGGPRINSHKRGLRGERKKKKKIKYFKKKENILL